MVLRPEQTFWIVGESKNVINVAGAAAERVLVAHLIGEEILRDM